MDKKYTKGILWDIETTGLMDNLMERILTIVIHDLETNQTVVFMEKNDKGELDEKTTIEKFYDYVGQYDNLKLIGYNSDSFDIPFLIRRSVVYGIKIPPFKNADLRKIANGFFYSYDRMAKGKLSDWAVAMGIEIKTENGSNMFKYYMDKQYDKIKEHCLEDIEITKTLYERVEKCGLV